MCRALQDPIPTRSHACITRENPRILSAMVIHTSPRLIPQIAIWGRSQYHRITPDQSGSRDDPIWPREITMREDLFAGDIPTYYHRPDGEQDSQYCTAVYGVQAGKLPVVGRRRSHLVSRKRAVGSIFVMVVKEVGDRNAEGCDQLSLLMIQPTEEAVKLAQEIFQRQFAEDECLSGEYDERRRRRMMEDIHYNLALLDTVLHHGANSLYVDYAGWIFDLLRSRMPDLPAERVAQHMVHHYRMLEEVTIEHRPAVDAPQIHELMEQVIEHTRSLVSPASTAADSPQSDEWAPVRRQYLDALLRSDRSGAAAVIDDALTEEASIADVYTRVFQPVMEEVGRLWHMNQITVATEHYCTAVTQGIMTRFYSQIFSTPRRGRTLLAACVDNELHEMGLRMLCDLVEYEGWDTVYLGAALPLESLLKAVESHRPDVMALSVTMPHHLDACRETVEALQRKDPELQLALGGRAFQVAPELARKWGADYTSSTVEDFLQWIRTFESGT